MSVVKGNLVVVKDTNTNDPICFTGSLTVTYKGEVIDITNSCSGGFTELLDGHSTNEQVEIGAEMFFDDSAMRKKIKKAKLDKTSLDLTVDYGGTGETIVGTFRVSSYSESAAMDGVTSVSSTLVSTGSFTTTEAS